MTSCFGTPLGDVWMTNGSAESVLIGCATVARRQGLTGTPIGRAVVAALDEHRMSAGMGCFGFEVDRLSPFDQPEPRRLLAALVAEVARDGARDVCDPELTEVAWHELEPFHRCLWLSVDNHPDPRESSISKAITSSRWPARS